VWLSATYAAAATLDLVDHNEDDRRYDTLPYLVGKKSIKEGLHTSSFSVSHSAIYSSTAQSHCILCNLFMLHKTRLVLTVLTLSLFVVGSPLEQREAAPGIIEDLLKGVLTAIPQLIKDVLAGVKSAIDDTKSNKPLTCILSSNKCCVCMSIATCILYASLTEL
jgi:hypothetical protein